MGRRSGNQPGGGQRHVAFVADQVLVEGGEAGDRLTVDGLQLIQREQHPGAVCGEDVKEAFEQGPRRLPDRIALLGGGRHRAEPGDPATSHPAVDRPLAVMLGQQPRKQRGGQFLEQVPGLRQPDHQPPPTARHLLQLVEDDRLAHPPGAADQDRAQG